MGVGKPQKQGCADLCRRNTLTTVTCVSLAHTLTIRHRAKYILVLVCAICVWPALVNAQQATDAATVRALELKWTEAYKMQQLDRLSSFLDDDCVSTFEDGSVFGGAVRRPAGFHEPVY